MSPKPIVLDPDIRSLQDAGLCVEVAHGHLLVHNIPYVSGRSTVERGIMITNLGGNVGSLGAPPDHQVWFAGEFPCHANGQPIEAIRHSAGPFALFPGFSANFRFSNKPEGGHGFPTYAAKIRHYLSIIAPEAAGLDPSATPYTFEPIISMEPDHPFHYWDSSSSRAGILAVSAKLACDRIGIIGLGGTGAYVLDLVAKTPVRKIHLFDGDAFEQHSAFRAPGAASLREIEERLPKVDYFARRYDFMRKGIVPHGCYIDEDNYSLLDGLEFAFLCVDQDDVRRQIGDALLERAIPFVDVGMGLILPEGETALTGTCRATLCTPSQFDHFEKHVPSSSQAGGDVYRSNIQVADMNMMNAALAVGLWKKYLNFYFDHWRPHHTTYSIDSHSLTRDAFGNPPVEAV